jgi:hypothetical protein
MSLLIGLAFATAALGATPLPSTSVETSQKVAWTGLGMSTVGTALVLTGGFAFYKGPFDAVDRFQGKRDPQKTDPRSAIASGLVVGSGMGFSAVGRPILSLGSALSARQYAAEGAPVSPTLGWISVGAWAAGVGTYFFAQSSGSETLDYAWAGLRVTSTGTGLAQLLQTRAAIQGASGTSKAQSTTQPSVRLVLNGSGGALVGTF